jgi:hypothetical protein
MASALRWLSVALRSLFRALLIMWGTLAIYYSNLPLLEPGPPSDDQSQTVGCPLWLISDIRGMIRDVRFR